MLENQHLDLHEVAGPPYQEDPIQLDFRDVVENVFKRSQYDTFLSPTSSSITTAPPVTSSQRTTTATPIFVTPPPPLVLRGVDSAIAKYEDMVRRLDRLEVRRWVKPAAQQTQRPKENLKSLTERTVLDLRRGQDISVNRRDDNALTPLTKALSPVVDLHSTPTYKILREVTNFFRFAVLLLVIAAIATGMSGLLVVAVALLLAFETIIRLANYKKTDDSDEFVYVPIIRRAETLNVLLSKSRPKYINTDVAKRRWRFQKYP